MSNRLRVHGADRDFCTTTILPIGLNVQRKRKSSGNLINFLNHQSFESFVALRAVTNIKNGINLVSHTAYGVLRFRS